MINTITIKNATVILDRKKVLDSINLEVPEGSHQFILGANGSGKTTLMHMLLGYVWPLFGAEINVFGQRFGRCNLSDLRKKVSWVSAFLQNWTNANWPVIEVVVSGLDGTIGLYRDILEDERDLALKVLESLDAAKLADRPFSHLSSGEQMKILIARALISKPRLMIFDEACVHLDLKTREFLLETIDDLAIRKDTPTILFITQRIEDISSAFTNGIILKNGKIIANGSRDKIITEENIRNAFDVDVELVKTANNRYWTILRIF